MALAKYLMISYYPYDVTNKSDLTVKMISVIFQHNLMQCAFFFDATPYKKSSKNLWSKIALAFW